MKLGTKNLEDVKTFLRSECKDALPEQTKWNHYAAVMPILHNGDHIHLLFKGWSINLYSDGTWFWEDTSGG